MNDIWNYYVNTFVDNYVNFSGRARRKEFWSFFLVHILILFGIQVAAVSLELEALLAIYFLYFVASFVPWWAVCVRRLHDTGVSGFFMFIVFIPLFGLFIMLFQLLSDSMESRNEYGPNPKKPYNPDEEMLDMSEHLVE